MPCKSIDHIARLKDRLLRTQAKRELEALATEGAASIETNSNGPRKAEIEPRLPGSKGKRDVRGWLIAHRPMQALFRQMDGFKDGFMFDNLWRPGTRGAQRRRHDGPRGRGRTEADPHRSVPRRRTARSTRTSIVPALNANLSRPRGSPSRSTPATRATANGSAAAASATLARSPTRRCRRFSTR
jgi:hypothetical protein